MPRIVKRCPECGEMVSALLTRCRYCPHRFTMWTLQVWGMLIAVAVLVLLVW
jgi:hypothetical protein